MLDPVHPEPANPAATTEARELLTRIQATAGIHVLSGQHNTPRKLSAYSDEAAELTGHYPAVWGEDVGFAADGDMDGVNFRQAVIDEAIDQHRAGSAVTLMWHAVRPTEDEPVTFDGGFCAGPLPQADWHDLLTEEALPTRDGWRRSTRSSASSPSSGRLGCRCSGGRTTR